MKSVSLEEVVALNELEAAEVLQLVVVVELLGVWAHSEGVEALKMVVVVVDKGVR